MTRTAAISGCATRAFTSAKNRDKLSTDKNKEKAMNKRNLTKVELDTCEMVAKLKKADDTVAVPAEVLYNLAREVKVSRHKLTKAGAVKAELKKTLEEMTAQWEQLHIDPFKAKKEEAASTAMDTTSSVELTTPTDNIIAQCNRIEQYLKEKHLQNDSLEDLLVEGGAEDDQP